MVKIISHTVFLADFLLLRSTAKHHQFPQSGILQGTLLSVFHIFLYDNGVIEEILSDITENGLPDHCFLDINP